MLTRWFLRIGCVLLPALMPLIGPGPWVAGVLLVPLLCAWRRAENERLMPTVTLAVFAASAALLITQVPGDHSWYPLYLRLAYLQGLITAVCLGLVWLPASANPVRDAGALCAGLAIACTGFAALPASGLQEEIMALLRTWNGLDRMLLSLYGQRVQQEATLQQMAILRFVGVLDDSLRQQLLLSFDLLLGSLLKTTMPQLIVGYSAGMAALCAGVRDEVRCRRVGWRELPEPINWHLPRGWGIRIGLLWLGNAVPYFTDNSVALMFGYTCAAVCTVAYSIQGMVFIRWWMKDRGLSAGMTVAACAALMMFLPFICVLLGFMDQTSDPRKLREPLAGMDGDDENDDPLN